MNKIIIFNRNKLQGYQIISIIGLLPYLICGLYYQSIIAFIIFLNGILYWTTMSDTVCIIDIIFNIILIIFVNMFTNYQPETFYHTLIGISSWVLNYYNTKTITSSLFHVIMVQTPLGCGLYYYIRE